MNTRDFDRIVEEAYRKIPLHFRKRMNNVAIVVEQEPPRGRPLLGLYEGRPLTFRQVSDGFVLPDRITIYQGPHERQAASPEQLRQLVEETIWHEIAHHFGMDEKRVRAAEKRRRIR